MHQVSMVMLQDRSEQTLQDELDLLLLAHQFVLARLLMQATLE